MSLFHSRLLQAGQALQRMLLLAAAMGGTLITPNGFSAAYTINIPSGDSLIANQLDHGGNTLDEVLPGVPDGSVIGKWNCSGFTQYIYDSLIPGWSPGGGILRPGEGAFFHNPGPAFQLAFTGNRHEPALPLPLPCGCNQENLVSRQTTNAPSSFMDIMGFPPPDGTTLRRWTGSTHVTYTRANGAWLPAVPSVNRGESVFVRVPCSNQCLAVTCAPNKTVECGSNWSFDPPRVEVPCCGTNFTVGILSTVVSNQDPCLQIATRTWQITDCASNSTTCSQTVAVRDITPPAIIACASNVPMDLRQHPTKPMICQKWIPDVTTAVVATDNSGPVTITQSPAAGTLNSDDTHVVTVTVTDRFGNSSTCISTVLDVPPATGWHGTVKFANGTPLAGETVRLTVYSPFEIRTTVTDASGTYSFPNAPESSWPDWEWDPERFRGGYARTGDLSTGGGLGEWTCQDRQMNFTPYLAYEIRGRITDSRGIGLPGLEVNIRRRSGTGASTLVRTDSSGSYRLSIFGQPDTYEVIPAGLEAFTFTPGSAAITFDLRRNYYADFTATSGSAATPPAAGRLAFAAYGVARSPTQNTLDPLHPLGATRYFDNGTAVVNGDGTGYHWLGPFAEKHRSHAFSPDGTRIAYAVDDMVAKLYVVNADGSGRRLAAVHGFISDSISWSPDSSSLAYVASDNPFDLNAAKIMIASADGGMITRLSVQNLWLVDELSWSPDGTKFATTDSFSDRLESIDSSTGSSTGLLTPKIQDPNARFAIIQAHPSWSPDGRHLAFDDSLGAGIYLFDTVAGTSRRLQAYGKLSQPTWSPDGSFLAYQDHHTPANSHHIMISRTDGSQARSISLGRVASHSWSRKTRRPSKSGGNPPITFGNATVYFSSVTSAGETSIETLSPSALPMPSGFFPVNNSAAYEISTTATTAGPITVCFKVPTVNNPSQFARLRILHGEPDGGTGKIIMRDRTILAPDSPAPDFSQRIICARVAALSPFAIAEAIEPNLPQITGSVMDTNGLTLAGVSFQIASGETNEVETASDGTFTLPNLSTNATYVLTPRLPGFSFLPPFVILESLTNSIRLSFLAVELNPPPVPQLSIARDPRLGSQLSASWQGKPNDFLLEYTDSLHETNWYPVNPLPVPSGEEMLVPLEPRHDQRFFRLRQR